MQYKHIILIGMPASGKSSVGAQLAAKLGKPLYDNDLLLEEKHAQSISSIFKELGEDKFRAYESEMLKEVLGREAGVISLGGGSVIDQENRDVIKNNNLVVYLQAQIATLIKNLADSDERPLLAGQADKEDLLKSLLQQRDDLYRECCSIIVDVDGLSLQEITEEIISRIANENST